MKTNTAIILLGTNLGRRMQNLIAATHKIKALGKLVKHSSVYETAAWGKEEQQPFLNQVLVLKSKWPPRYLMRQFLNIEQQLGRERQEKWGPRLIDIDLIFYDSLIMNSPQLVIPHPEMQNRKFTLAPLVELMPNYKHPISNKTMQNLLDECKDHLLVNKL